jgi:hypothetical protein
MISISVYITTVNESAVTQIMTLPLDMYSFSVDVVVVVVVVAAATTQFIY